MALPGYSSLFMKIYSETSLWGDLKDALWYTSPLFSQIQGSWLCLFPSHTNCYPWCTQDCGQSIFWTTVPEADSLSYMPVNPVKCLESNPSATVTRAPSLIRLGSDSRCSSALVEKGIILKEIEKMVAFTVWGQIRGRELLSLSLYCSQSGHNLKGK